GSQAGSNTVLATTGAGPATTTLQGINSDQYLGSGTATGISFRVTDPTTIQSSANPDAITVTQNPALQFQVGASSGAVIHLGIDSQSSTNLGVNGVDMTTQKGAEAGITTIQSAITQVSTAQATLGAFQNRLTDAQNAASAFEMNLMSANSNIVDANIPQETIRFTRDQILLQAGTAVLAQANQSPATLLSLLSAGTSGR
ncbi:MAG: hypothetical protein KGJ86_07410, partial [Chloroflexota bacterium]|nr:hypothetical protein [Chloroflexota bacterium]